MPTQRMDDRQPNPRSCPPVTGRRNLVKRDHPQPPERNLEELQERRKNSRTTNFPPVSGINSMTRTASASTPSPPAGGWPPASLDPDTSPGPAPNTPETQGKT